MTRAQFLRICAGLAVAPLTAAGELRASTQIRAWAAHPGGGGSSGGDGDHGGDDGGDDGGGVGWGDGGTGGPGGNPGGKQHCNPHFPSPENDTIVLGIIGGGAAFWPQLKAKLENLLK